MIIITHTHTHSISHYVHVMFLHAFGLMCARLLGYPVYICMAAAAVTKQMNNFTVHEYQKECMR